MNRLSVCMIVKDEEQLLPRCLASIKGLADEIIVVDTGSTDRTKDIAAEYGARLFDFKWTNNFAEARNESLRHATGKWILVLDADEYLSEPDYTEWDMFLNTEEPQAHIAYTLPVINFTGAGNSQEFTTAPVTRLFPNYMGIQFEGPIHEQLTRGGSGQVYHKKLSLYICHTGYQASVVTRKNKHERNMSIFNEMMKKQEEMTPYDWFTLGNQHRYAREVKEALYSYKKAMEIDDTTAAWYPFCLVGFIGLVFQRNPSEAWDITDNKLSNYSDYADYHTIRGIQYESLGFVEEAKQCYLTALNVAEQRAKEKSEIWLVEPNYSFETPVNQMIEISFRLNDNQEAIYWLSRLLAKDKHNPVVILKLVEWLSQNDSAENIISFLNGIYDIEKKEELILLLKVSMALGQVELVNHYYSGLDDRSSLSILDQVRLAVTTENYALWKHTEFNPESFELNNQLLLWVQLAVGAIRWDDSSKLEEIKRKSQYAQVSDISSFFIAKWFRNEEVDPTDSDKFSDTFFLVAKQLFLLKQYELFDQFVKSMYSYELVNNLANYFYSMNQMKLALDYYSILLSKGKLNAGSYANLGLYHCNQGFYEDGVDFLAEAVRLQPDAKQLYYPLIRHAPADCKEEYIRLFQVQVPECVNISFVREFLQQEGAGTGIEV